MKTKRKTALKKKVWKKLDKKSTPVGALIYTQPSGSQRMWVGIKKYPQGWMVRTPSGMQKSHFKTKLKAMAYMKAYMKKHK